jgi:cobalt-zinc-cadmium efflux system membrane fusion protein
MKNIMLKKCIPAAFLIAISFFSLTACNEAAEKKEERQQYVIPDSLLKTLRIDTVKTCPLVDAITLTGMVDFNQDKQVNIYPLVSRKVEDIKVQLGDYVEKGQVLAVIKSSEMAGYSNSLVNAQTNLAVAKKNLDAQRDLFKSGLASSLDVNNAEANYQQAVAQLELIERFLKINSNNTQGNYFIKAPISGFIVQKNITNNTAIRTDNGNNLFTISDLKDVWIYANVYESNISKIHLGDPVDVTTISYPNRVFKGRIDKMMNVLDPTNKVMKVRVVLPNNDYALKPQMFASILVTNKENKQSICISSKALVFDNSRYYVLKYEGNGKAVKTPVEVINTIGDKTYIASGINVGDQIMASQAILIYDTLNN